MSEIEDAQTVARAAIAKLKQADQQLRDEYEALVKARSLLTDLPAPVDEVVRNMHALVDQKAAELVDDCRHGLIRAFSGRLELERDGTFTTVRPQLYLPPDQTKRWFFDWYLFAPELVKARLEQVIRGKAYEAGGPMADRLRLIQEADERILAKEDEHASLCDLAASLDPPIRIELLPSVSERREQERRTREERDRIADVQREQQEADARARANEFPVSMNMSRTGIPSQYIESGGASMKRPQ
jgi:hypothetical protein